MSNTFQAQSQLLKEVDDVASTLDRSSYMPVQKITKLSGQLDVLFAKVDSLLSKENPFAATFLKEQKERLVSLYGRCHTLEVDSKVVELAESAEKLYTFPSAQIPSEVQLLQERMNDLRYNYSLSIENRQLLRFAELLMNRFTNNKTSKSPIEFDPNNKETEIAIRILELAKALYESNYSLARELYFALPNATKAALKTVFAEHKLKIESLFMIGEHSFKRPDLAVQLLVGYSDVITLQTSHFTLPGLEEIDQLFSASDNINF